MSEVRVVHVLREIYHVYIGRRMDRYRLPAGILQNPHRGPREQAIALFRADFYADTAEGEELRLYAETELCRHQKKHGDAPFLLGCWCAPKPCHGDVVKEYLERLGSP